jgi:ornithine cyclodeaminase
MSKTAFAATMAVRPGIETVKIKGRSKKSTDGFVNYLNEEFPQIKDIRIVDTIEDAVRDSDVVHIATSSPTGDVNEYPYIKEEWIKPCAILCCPAAARFDDDFILNRARTVTDNIQLYEAWAEEMDFPAYNSIPIPAVHCMDLIAEGKMSKEQIDDLGDVLIGKIPVHRKEDEIVIYSVGGMPVEDVAWGTIVYRNAVEKGIGTQLNLWDTPKLA